MLESYEKYLQMRKLNSQEKKGKGNILKVIKRFKLAIIQ